MHILGIVAFVLFCFLLGMARVDGLRWIGIPVLVIVAIFCFFIGNAGPNTAFMIWWGWGAVATIVVWSSKRKQS
jgi:hypothetical protein